MIILCSVEDPGCLSLVLISVHPRSRIQKQQQKRGMKKFCCPIFFCGQKYKKIVNYLIFELVKKTMWATSQRIIEFLPKKLSFSSQKYRFGIKDLEKTYSGSRIRLSNTDFFL
jgi:hypothetical protein